MKKRYSGLIEVEDMVKQILKSDIRSRNDDNRLYFMICNRVGRSQNIELSYLRFEYVMNNISKLNLPSFKSVERCRRKLQRLHPELRCSDEVDVDRFMLESTYQEYNKGVHSCDTRC